MKATLGTPHHPRRSSTSDLEDGPSLVSVIGHDGPPAPGSSRVAGGDPGRDRLRGPPGSGSPFTPGPRHARRSGGLTASLPSPYLRATLAPQAPGHVRA